MPLPWKKVKSARISQLVNDHLHNTQKRRDGSSLVVETGFPTSLIDLFIKNREKLKKPSKKKRQNPPNTPLSMANNPLIEGSPPPPPPPSLAGSSTPLRCPSPAHNREGSVVGSSDRATLVDEMVSDVNRVLLGVIKIFLVVVLALGTKRLAVGITISAFLLFFLEYVSKHASGLLRPCSVILLGVGRLLRLNGDNPCQEIREVDPKDYSYSSSLEDDEIMEEPCSEKPLLESMEKEEPLLESMEKEEPLNDVVAESKRKSRRAKIKSKMKKYVTKKFRNSVKHDDLQRPETLKHESVVSYEEQLENDVRFSEEDGTTSELQSYTSEIREEAADMKMEEKVLKWRHLLLCLILLIGLMGGKALAIVLTLSWFLLLKLGETLPRYIKSGQTSVCINNKPLELNLQSFLL